MLGALLLNWKRCYLFASMVLLLVGFCQVSWSIWMYGMAGGTWIYFIILVFFPYFTFRVQHRSIAHFFALSAGLALIGFLAYKDHFPAQITVIPEDLQIVVNVDATVVTVLIMASSTRLLVDNSEEALKSEQQRVDALLLNVLPPSIATRLKEHPDDSIADRHPEITVLFADIVGFTPLSSRLSAVQTVELLNQVFTAFDTICDRIGVEKVRTIGDGYMAVAGAPLPRADHASAIARVAMDMREYMRTAELQVPLEVRIGINSGEAVAGIVGTSRFHYDLWGDAVNVAARMESTGVPGKIQIARPTWEHINESIPCESRWIMQVKGKGEMETWFVL